MSRNFGIEAWAYPEYKKTLGHLTDFESSARISTGFTHILLKHAPSSIVNLATNRPGGCGGSLLNSAEYIIDNWKKLLHEQSE